MKYLITLVVVFLVAPFVFSEVKNSNEPASGEWDLQLIKEWELVKAGDMLFNRPDQLVVSNEDWLYVKDIKYRIIHMIDNHGKFVKSFGQKGEGPGELKHHMQIYDFVDFFVAADQDRLHYFKKDASFIRSVINYWYKNRTEFFLNPQEFVTYHLDPKSIPFEESEGKGKIILSNLKTNNKRTLTEFKYSKKGQVAFRTKELTPNMIIGYDRSKKALYYGMIKRGRCLTLLLYASDSFRCSVVSLFHSSLLLSGRFDRKIPKGTRPNIVSEMLCNALLLPDSITHETIFSQK